jgi:hypothetical protein
LVDYAADGAFNGPTAAGDAAPPEGHVTQVPILAVDVEITNLGPDVLVLGLATRPPYQVVDNFLPAADLEQLA